MESSYKWHTCDYCRHQCPHEGVVCRCPWCGWTHANVHVFDPKQDGDGISHSTPMDDLTCQLAVIAGWLTLISGTDGLVYKGEQTREHVFTGEQVRGLLIEHPDIPAGMVYLIRDMGGWRYAQNNWAVLKKLGTPEFTEGKAAA
jgi:hypothetical protein